MGVCGVGTKAPATASVSQISTDNISYDEAHRGAQVERSECYRCPGSSVVPHAKVMVPPMPSGTVPGMVATVPATASVSHISTDNMRYGVGI